MSVLFWIAFAVWIFGCLFWTVVAWEVARESEQKPHCIELFCDIFMIIFWPLWVIPAAFRVIREVLGCRKQRDHEEETEEDPDPFFAVVDPPIEPKEYPTVEDCREGLWVELTNGWIVGPIVDCNNNFFDVVVSDDGMQFLVVDVMGNLAAGQKSSRIVKRVFDPNEEAVSKWRECYGESPATDA